MANICSTAIQFTGEEDALKDLFQRLDVGWLGNVAKEFDVQANTGGDIEDFDDEVYRVWQSDRWTPNVEIWRQIIDKYYKNKISFVYIAEESGCGVFINTDETGEYFPAKYMCDYTIGQESDVIYFEDEKEFVDWVKEKFCVNVSTEEEAIQAVDDFNYSCTTDEFCTVGVFENPEY